MTLRDTDYALLAQDAYSDRGIEKNFYLDGVQYKAIAHADRPSGYQGTAYQRIDTGEIVIAHRGTEFGRQPIRDGLIADGGMVLAGYNSQVKEPYFDEIRYHADKLELLVDDQEWVLTKYRELLFLR